MKVVIIGAGVAGLGIGWRLLQARLQVTILERAQPGARRELGRGGNAGGDRRAGRRRRAERALAMRANALWPDFAAELEEASGRAVFLNRGGALLLAADAAELEVMRARAGGCLRMVDAGEARALVPLLGEPLGGLWSPRRSPCRQPRPGRGPDHRLPEGGRGAQSQRGGGADREQGGGPRGPNALWPL